MFRILVMGRMNSSSPSEEAMGWVITKDHVSSAGEKSDEGRCSTGYPHVRGPWHEFRIYDDDGELYYEGKSSSKSFDPLDDFGTPNAGATSIAYRNKSGEWVVL